MRRRASQEPARRWTGADMPANLRELVADEWGCSAQHSHMGKGCAAFEAWHRARRRWLDDHGVNLLTEMREDMAAQRRAQNRTSSAGGGS